MGNLYGFLYEFRTVVAVPVVEVLAVGNVSPLPENSGGRRRDRRCRSPVTAGRAASPSRDHQVAARTRWSRHDAQPRARHRTNGNGRSYPRVKASSRAPTVFGFGGREMRPVVVKNLPSVTRSNVVDVQNSMLLASLFRLAGRQKAECSHYKAILFDLYKNIGLCVCLGILIHSSMGCRPSRLAPGYLPTR